MDKIKQIAADFFKENAAIKEVLVFEDGNVFLPGKLNDAKNHTKSTGATYSVVRRKDQAESSAKSFEESLTEEADAELERLQKELAATIDAEKAKHKAADEAALIAADIGAELAEELKQQHSDAPEGLPTLEGETAEQARERFRKSEFRERVFWIESLTSVEQVEYMMQGQTTKTVVEAATAHIELLNKK